MVADSPPPLIHNGRIYAEKHLPPRLHLRSGEVVLPRTWGRSGAPPDGGNRSGEKPPRCTSSLGDKESSIWKILFLAPFSNFFPFGDFSFATFLDHRGRGAKRWPNLPAGRSRARSRNLENCATRRREFRELGHVAWPQTARNFLPSRNAPPRGAIFSKFLQWAPDCDRPSRFGRCEHRSNFASIARRGGTVPPTAGMRVCLRSAATSSRAERRRVGQCSKLRSLLAILGHLF